MRLSLRMLVAVALFGAGAALTNPSCAQTANPNSDAIVKALTPTGAGVAGPSRGIRLANPAPEAAAPSGKAPSGTASSGSAPSATASTGNAPSVNLSVQFQKGSADLTAAAMHTLNELGKALNQPALATYRFRIEGHTDTVGTADYNKELSDRRAAAVVAYLSTTFKVDPSRLEAVGKGEDGLLVPTPDQTSEPRNRRVVVVNLGS
jgi:OOP family OmpA-OmpF porin